MPFQIDNWITLLFGFSYYMNLELYPYIIDIHSKINDNTRFINYRVHPSWRARTT